MTAWLFYPLKFQNLLQCITDTSWFRTRLIAIAMPQYFICKTTHRLPRNTATPSDQTVYSPWCWTGSGALINNRHPSLRGWTFIFGRDSISPHAKLLPQLQGFVVHLVMPQKWTSRLQNHRLGSSPDLRSPHFVSNVSKVIALCYPSPKQDASSQRCKFRSTLI